jgi:hypothetical protein
MADDLKAMVARMEASIAKAAKDVDPLKVIPCLPFSTENIELSGRLIKAAMQYTPEGATEMRRISWSKRGPNR